MKPLTETEYKRLWYRLQGEIRVNDDEHGIHVQDRAHDRQLNNLMLAHNLRFYKAVGLVVDDPVTEEESAQ